MERVPIPAFLLDDDLLLHVRARPLDGVLHLLLRLGLRLCVRYLEMHRGSISESRRALFESGLAQRTRRAIRTIGRTDKMPLDAGLSAAYVLHKTATVAFSLHTRPVYTRKTKGKI